MSTRAGCLWAFLGAVAANPVAFLFAFLWGAVFGVNEIGGASQTAYGVEGGTRAIGTLAIVFAFSIGICPLVNAGIGACLAFGIAWRISIRRSPTQTSN